MKRSFLRIFPVYLIFTLIMTFFHINRGKELLSGEYLGMIIPLTLILFFMTLTHYAMGRPPDNVPVTGSFQNALIDFGIKLNRRSFRRWISCSWGFDENSVFVYTFRKIKEKADIKEIVDIVYNGSSLKLVFEDRTWVISGKGYEDAVSTLKQKAGLK